MAITKSQLEKRKQFIGSSDAPAIVGCSPLKADGTPYQTPYDVWAEKTGRLEKREDTKFTTRGRYVEPSLLKFASDFLGGSIIKQGLEKTNGIIIDHPDGLFKPNQNPIEAKAQSIWAKEKWGEDGTGEVPLHVAVQCEIHLFVWEKDICYVPADIPYRINYSMYIVQRDENVIKWILEKCQEFWELYVLKDTPPPDMPSMETIKRMIRQPNKTISIPKELVLTREQSKEKAKAAQAAFEADDLALKAALGDAECGTFEGGRVTFFNQHRNAEKKPREAYDFRQIKIEMEK